MFYAYRKGDASAAGTVLECEKRERKLEVNIVKTERKIDLGIKKAEAGGDDKGQKRTLYEQCELQ